MASPEKKARYDVSRQVKDAMARDDWAEVARILSECSRRDSDSVMTQLVSRDQWDAVKKIITCVGDEERTWSIEGVLAKNNILLSVAECNWREIGEMPHERFLHSTLRWILEQSCKRARQTDIVQYVLPHCEDDQLDSALQQLVTHGLWCAAGRLLQRGGDNEQVRRAIQVAYSRAREDVVMAYVVPSCPNSALEFLLTELVFQRMWHAASRVLMRGVSDGQHCWALKEACCWAEGWQVKNHLLPVCTHGQCNSVMTDLALESQWRSVEKLFHCVGNASMTMIGDTVHMDNQCLQLILSKDWISTLDLLAINKRGSEEVSQCCKRSTRDAESVFQIYQRHNGVLRRVEFDTDFSWVDGEQCFPPIVKDLDSVFAVKCNIVIIDRQKETVVCIIPRCAGHQLDSVFTQCCDTFLKSRPSREFVCTSTHGLDTWAIHKLDVNSAHAQATVITSSKSTEDQLNSVLRQMLTLPAWWTLGKVLEQGLDDSSVTQILKQTLLYNDDQMIVEHVLPHCTDSQTDLAVTELVSAGQWKSVTKFVQLVGDRKQTWTVGGTSVDTTLLHLVAGGRWGEVGDMLQRGVDDAQFRWATDIATLNADDSVYSEHILPLVVNFRSQHIDLVLEKMVSRGSWSTVNKILQLDRKLMCTVNETSIDRETIHLVAEGKWREVGIMLTHGVIDILHLWLTQTASSNANSTEFIKYILPRCADDQLDSVLTTLVDRRLWRAVGEVLKRGVSDSVKQWAVTKTFKIFEEYDLNQHDVNHDRYQYDGKFLIENILPHCPDDQLDSVLRTLVKRRMWRAVGEMLKRGVSDSVRQRIIVAACTNCGEDSGDYINNDRESSDNCDTVDGQFMINTILPHCADDQLDSVLTTLVERRLWGAVGEVLKRNAYYCLIKLAVQQTCTLFYPDHLNYEAEDVIINTILPHCTDDHLDFVLTTLVKQRLWWGVGEVLNRGVSDSVKQWAVTKTFKIFKQRDVDSDNSQYDGQFLIDNILPHCADDQLDSVLTTLVKRRMWRVVAKVLNRGVSDSVKRWAVTKTCKKLTVDDLYNYESTYEEDADWDQFIIYEILPHCADDQLDSVLKTLVERRIWCAASEVLNRGVSDSVKRWAVTKTVKTFDKWEFYGENLKTINDELHDTFLIDDILPHCADDQLDSVLTTLVERRMWRAVEEMLKRGVSDSVKQLAVTEACRYCFGNKIPVHTKKYIMDDILPLCADNQMDSLLTVLVESGRWQAVGKMLSRFGNAIFQQCVVQKACEHCKSIEVYFRDDHSTPADDVTPDVLALFADDELDLIQDKFKTNDVCTAVRYESGREVSDSQRRVNIKTAFAHADQNSLIEYILPYYGYDSIQSALEKLASRCFWKAFSLLLHYFIIDTLCMWTLATNDIEPKEKVFLDVVRNPCEEVKRQIPSFWRLVNWSDLQCFLNERLHWDTPFSEVLCGVLLGAVKEIWLSRRWKEIPLESADIMDEASSIVKELHQLVIPVLMECNTSCVPYLLLNIQKTQHQLDERRSMFCPFLPIYFAKCLIQEYYKRKAWQEMTDAILVVLTTVPVVSGVQSVALRVMLRHNRWDVISHACLSGVCEQDRRQLFQAAVKQRQWSAVKRWADHTLYDDQRLWALGEARQEKRWDVYLKLADHGLSEWERVGVLFRVTMHADWKLVRHMLRTVADVTDMIDLLTNTPGALSKLGAMKHAKRMSDLTEFKTVLTKVYTETRKKVFKNILKKECEKTLKKISEKSWKKASKKTRNKIIEKTRKKVCKKARKKDTFTLKTLEIMIKRGKWWVVLHNIHHQLNLQHARRALQVAVSSEAWHAVIQLVKLETNVTRRDSLLHNMVRLRQWAVCRELLEKGVSHDLSLKLLSEFIKHCQWTLVAMVMECTMDDDRRKKIMHQAIMMREGSVVWECVIKLQTGLSVDEREDVFQLAFNREVWQAVKPLIEEKDVTGIRHRDTALLEAIEQHQWDVVDHCQRHHADINMKDDDGHTPIHRAARKGDWEAVKELTVRDGDPNLLDSEGLSVLHRAIRAEQWDAVKLLIQFHGDIHLARRYGSTPLQMLIDARQGEVIESSLMWCPDQQKVVNYGGETVLHAVCLSDWPGALYHLIARKVDPLVVTKRGLTALCYAVLCKDCPQRMVAECIKLGFSTHQSHITHTARNGMSLLFDSLTEEEGRLLKSPLVLAVMRGLHVVTQMLCEAGEYSSRQLRELNVHLVELTKPNTDKGWEFRSTFSAVWKCVNNLHHYAPDYSFDTELMEQSADYLRQVSSTPRSLVSTCRLVISRCLTLSKTRHRDIAQLPLSPRMKDYLMFSDLTDPRYPDLS